MKRPGFSILFVLVMVLTFANCARRGTPDGGPTDELPPEYVRASPENFTTNFDSDLIKIYFNEFIKLEDPQRQVIISPPMDPRAEITPLGTASKSIRIRINDTLQPRTTYTINFGRSITDNNEGNPLSFFTYAFSTGPYIDSLTVGGSVSDAILNVPDPFISIMLYEVDSTYTDSVVYSRMPRYVTNTLDSATTFQLNNLKEGIYQMVGIRDVNNNYTFEPETDKIAFADEYIELPTDEEINLTLFQEVLQDKFERPQQVAEQHLLFGYKGVVQRDSLSIEMISPPDDFEYRVTKDAKTDTLHFWYKPALGKDTLNFLVETPRFKDTLLVRLRERARDSLRFSFEPSSSIGFLEDLKIRPNLPLLQVNDSLVQIMDKDTLPVAFTGAYDAWKNEYVVSFDKNENQTYKVTALPGAFTGFFGTQNDTLRTQLRTQALSDLGSLTVELQNVPSFPIIVQLTDAKGIVQAEKYSTERTSLNFQYMKPGEYYIRVIFDRNENQVWDTGSFLGRRQPERVVYYPEPFQIRPNWDNILPFNLAE